MSIVWLRLSSKSSCSNSFSTIFDSQERSSLSSNRWSFENWDPSFGNYTFAISPLLEDPGQCYLDWFGTSERFFVTKSVLIRYGEPDSARSSETAFPAIFPVAKKIRMLPFSKCFFFL